MTLTSLRRRRRRVLLGRVASQALFFCVSSSEVGRQPHFVPRGVTVTLHRRGGPVGCAGGGVAGSSPAGGDPLIGGTGCGASRRNGKDAVQHGPGTGNRFIRPQAHLDPSPGDCGGPSLPVSVDPSRLFQSIGLGANAWRRRPHTVSTTRGRERYGGRSRPAFDPKAIKKIGSSGFFPLTKAYTVVILLNRSIRLFWKGKRR